MEAKVGDSYYKEYGLWTKAQNQTWVRAITTSPHFFAAVGFPFYPAAIGPWNRPGHLTAF